MTPTETLIGDISTEIVNKPNLESIIHTPTQEGNYPTFPVYVDYLIITIPNKSTQTEITHQPEKQKQFYDYLSDPEKGTTRFNELKESINRHTWTLVSRGNLNKDCVEDITSETLLQTYRNIGSLREDLFEEGELSPTCRKFIYGITRHTVRHYFRSQKVQQKLASRYSQNLKEKTPLDDAMYAERIRLALGKMNTGLSPLSRRIVELSQQGIPYNTIAKIVGKPSNTVRMTYYRAINKLQTALSGK